MQVLSDERKLFAIRNKTTGLYLPELDKKLRSGGGYTHTEPTEKGTPRLFRSRHDANVALTWWLKGVTTVSYTTHGFSMEDMENEPEEEFNTRPAETPRVAADMEVVPMYLARVVEEVF